jgi:hypothetical protein
MHEATNYSDSAKVGQHYISPRDVLWVHNIRQVGHWISISFHLSPPPISILKMTISHVGINVREGQLDEMMEWYLKALAPLGYVESHFA